MQAVKTKSLICFWLSFEKANKIVEESIKYDIYSC